MYLVTFMTSYRDTVQFGSYLAGYFVHLFTHGMLYIQKGMSVNFNHKFIPSTLGTFSFYVDDFREPK